MAGARVPQRVEYLARASQLLTVHGEADVGLANQGDLDHVGRFRTLSEARGRHPIAVNQQRHGGVFLGQHGLL